MSDFKKSKARFVPVSDADFNQYAKNLAWLTGLGLSAAKERLAELYGFPSLYEMRKILEKGDQVAGPFSRSIIPHFMPNDDTLIQNSENCLSETSAEYWYRHNNIHKIVRYCKETCTTIRHFALFEVGFFCSPKIHKSLFKTTKEGIVAIESGNSTAIKDFFIQHWPVGFWGLLECVYNKPLKLDESNLKLLEVVQVRGPTTLMSDLWAVKASKIYQRITRDFVFDVEDYWFDDYPAPEKALNNPGLYDFNFLEFVEPCVYLDDILADISDEGLIEIYNALSHNSLDVRRFPALGTYLSQKKILEIRNRFYAARFAQLKAYSAACPDGLVEDVLVSCDTLPLDVTKNKRLTAYIGLQEPAYFSLDFKDSGVQILELDATFFQEPDIDGKPDTLVGAATGYVLMPWDSEYRRCSADTWFEALDCVSSQLYTVWNVLQEDYFPGQGMKDIDDFTAMTFSSIVVLSVELLPEFRGRNYMPHLFKTIYDALADHPWSTLDDSWYEIADELSGAPDIVTENGRTASAEDIQALAKIRVLAKPAVFVIPIEGSAPLEKSVNSFSNYLKRIKKDPSHPMEIRKRKLMAHFKAMESEFFEEESIDLNLRIVCYDPHEWPVT